MDIEKLYGQDSLWDEARSHYLAGHPEKAIEIYKYMLLRYAGDPSVTEYANAFIGDMYLTQRKLEEAEKHLRKAQEVNPENPDYHYLMGFVFSYRQQWPQAVSEMRIAVRHNPRKAEYLQGLGWALFLKGEKNRGLSYMEKAHALSPESVNILADLAMIYLDYDVNLAQQYAEKAVELEPGNPHPRRVLANIQAARAALEKIDEPEEYIVPEGTLIFRFKVALSTDPSIWRIIEIKHNQLLTTLHKAIMTAFSRPDERPYSFMFVTKPWDKQYEFSSSPPGISGAAKPAKSIRIDSIFMYQDETKSFSYVFDPENPCRHTIDFVDAVRKKTRASYPRIAKRQGKYP